MLARRHNAQNIKKMERLLNRNDNGQRKDILAPGRKNNFGFSIESIVFITFIFRNFLVSEKK